MTDTIQTATTTIAIDRTPGALTPRAQAVLCALRNGPRSSTTLSNATGDRVKSDVRSLLADLSAMHLVYTLAGTGEMWALTHDGIGWSESNGLSVSENAKEFASQWASQQEAAKS